MFRGTEAKQVSDFRDTLRSVVEHLRRMLEPHVLYEYPWVNDDWSSAKKAVAASVRCEVDSDYR